MKCNLQMQDFTVHPLGAFSLPDELKSISFNRLFKQKLNDYLQSQ